MFGSSTPTAYFVLNLGDGTDFDPLPSYWQLKKSDLCMTHSHFLVVFLDFCNNWSNKVFSDVFSGFNVVSETAMFLLFVFLLILVTQRSS